MKSFFKNEAFAVGLAMFSMFFGAGNIIFPLAVGQFAGEQNASAILGLILTAAIMPIVGVIAMILFKGNYKTFFGRLGRIPGFILALTVISLLGPLGSTPRCITLSYTTLKSSFLSMSPTLFSLIACVIIFIFTVKKRHILTLLGWVLTPILLISLITIIIIGLNSTRTVNTHDTSELQMFFHGLKEGYNTMDLLAAFFFSSTILGILKARSTPQEDENKYLKIAMQASLIGAFLLTTIYIGFSTLASFHADLLVSSKDELLAAITLKIAGPYAGVLVCITIAIACLTTAIALISAFTDFFQTEVFKKRVSYEAILIGALIITFFISTFNFTGISAFLGPILQICYPGLIVLTLLNIAYRLKKFKPIKVPVFVAFAISAILFVLT
ncbi:MAG: branched-chain amino acid transport system II carrier protein [Chlamydiales bacterium]|nr:branched-chain amino acid transport system II carrier protein [Chlamydiales bacterium]